MDTLVGGLCSVSHAAMIIELLAVVAAHEPCKIALVEDLAGDRRGTSSINPLDLR
ncbi:hypothetical protein D3C87_1792470 [compost metagenome]